MDLALRRPAGVGRIIDHPVEPEEILQRVGLFIIADEPDHLAGWPSAQAAA